MSKAINRVNNLQGKNNRSASLSNNTPQIIQYNFEKNRSKTPKRQVIVPTTKKSAYNPLQWAARPKIMPHYRVIHSNKYGFIAPTYESQVQGLEDSLYYREHEPKQASQLLYKKKSGNLQKSIARENFIPRISAFTPVKNIMNPETKSSSKFLLDSTASHNTSSETLKLAREYHLNPRLKLSRSRIRKSQMPNEMKPSELRLEVQKTDFKYMDFSLHTRSPTPLNETLNISLEKINTEASNSWIKPYRPKSTRIQTRYKQNSSRKSSSILDDSSLHISPDKVSYNVQKAVIGALGHSIRMTNISFYLQRAKITKERSGYVPKNNSILLSHL